MQRYTQLIVLIFLGACISLTALSLTEMLGADWRLLECGLLLACFAWMSRLRGISLEKNFWLILMVLIYAILVSYRLMFSQVEVKQYLESATEDDQQHAIQLGITFLHYMILGGSLALFIRNKITASYKPLINHSERTILAVMAFLPFLLIFLAYIFIFKGADYVALHSSGSVYGALALKSIYISYGACINLFYIISSRPIIAQDKWLISIITFFYLIFYGVLLQIRSPLLAYLLILFFFFGHQLSLLKIAVMITMLGVIFPLIAIMRSPGTYGGAEISLTIVQMLLSLGDFADTLNFAKAYVSSHGISWGSGVMGSLLGYAEPIANEYARDISIDYFNEGGGFGFFILSDFYINFGIWLGGILAICTGAFFVWGQRRFYAYIPAIILSSFISNVFALVRNDLGSTLRSCLYTIIATVIIAYAAKILQQKLTFCQTAPN